MMKIRKISRIPAAIENDPNVVNIDTNAEPVASASFRVSAFVLLAWRCRGASAGRSVRTTWFVSAAPEMSPPRLDTSTYLIRPGWPTAAARGAAA